MIVRPAGDAIPALRRLHALAPLGREAAARVVAGTLSARPVAARKELLTEGRPIREPLLLLDGWAAQVRILPDGRRQFISLVLPGDLIGHCGFADALAPSTTVCLTDVRVCALPDGAGCPDLDRAYAISRVLAEAHLAAQVTRLGRLDAHERILDLFLELAERLSLAGLMRAGGFPFPLTQEILADALGLTSVHVNRVVQVARRRGELQWTNRLIKLNDPASLRRQVGHLPVAIVEAPARPWPLTA